MGVACRSKEKGKGIRALDHARGTPSSRVPRVSLAPKTPFPKTFFPFPFKRLPRRLVWELLAVGYGLPVTFSTTFQAALDVYFLSVSFMKLTSGLL